MDIFTRVKKLNEYILPYVLILTPTLTALVVFTSFTRSFEFPKIILLNTLVLGIFLVFAIRLYKKKVLKIPSNFFSSTPAILILAFIFIIFLSTLASPQRLHSVWGSFERGIGLIQWGFFVGFFYLTLFLIRKKYLLSAIVSLLVGGTIISTYAILQYFSWDPIFTNFNVDFLEGRLFSTLGNPDFLAQYLAPLIVLSVYFFWRKKQILFLIPAVVMFLALLGTESRASFLALFGAIFILSFAIVKNKARWLQIVFGVFVLGVILFLIGAYLELPLFSRFQFNTENFRSVLSRLLIWKASLHLIFEHPFLGIGPDNFGIRFLEYLNSDFYYLEDSFNIIADRAHNEILDFGIIGGLPLIGIYLAMIYWVVKQIFSKDMMVQGLSLALIVYFLQNQLSFSQTSHFVLFFFLFACLIIATHKAEIIEWKATKSFRLIGIPLLFIFITFTFYQVVIKQVYAEAWYTYALATDDTKQGLINAINYTPLQSELRYNLLMWFPEERSEQLAALEIIEGRSIDVLAWQATGLSSVDPEQSYELFKEVIALNPQYPHTQRAYADALYRNEDFEGAAIQYERFFQISPPFWAWCLERESLSEYEKKKYRIFYKNVPDFNNSLIHLYNSYINLSLKEKADELLPYLECNSLNKF